MEFDTIVFVKKSVAVHTVTVSSEVIGESEEHKRFMGGHAR